MQARVSGDPKLAVRAAWAILAVTAFIVAAAWHFSSGLRPIPAFYYYTQLPSVADRPIVSFISVIGLFGASTVTIDWMRRIIQNQSALPLPFNHPTTVIRGVAFLMLLSVLLREGPDTMNFMTWPDISPVHRHTLALVNRFCDGLALVPFWNAWLLWIFSGRLISYQLARQPIPVELWPGWNSLKRPMLIGILVVLIGAGLTFGRMLG